MPPPNDDRPSFVRILALNRTVGIVLVSVLFFGLGEHLWSSFMPVYLQAKTGKVVHGQASLSWEILALVGTYAFLLNVFEGFCYIGGGKITAKLGDRGSLLLFGTLTITGYVLFLSVTSPVAAVVAALLIKGWEPLSVPVTFTTVGGTVAASRQGMAFALQSIQKRLPKILGPLIAGFVLAWARTAWPDVETSRVAGMRTLVALALALGLISIFLQLRYMPHYPPPPPGPSSRHILANLHPTLRRLLAAEICTRWCDWLVREFVILYVMIVRGVPDVTMGGLLALQNVVALLTYLPIGRMTERVGLQPFIGLTFIFFALFPLTLILVPDGWIWFAFVVCGLREIGEPARKALITSLLPADVRARAVGLYWGVRTFAMSTASLVGAAVWWIWGPEKLFCLAFSMGCLGATVFYSSYWRARSR